jgi:hypothetical protein
MCVEGAAYPESTKPLHLLAASGLRWLPAYVLQHQVCACLYRESLPLSRKGVHCVQYCNSAVAAPLLMEVLALPPTADMRG